VEVPGEPADPGEHAQRRDVQVGTLALPGLDDPVDLVLNGHDNEITRHREIGGRGFGTWSGAGTVEARGSGTHQLRRARVAAGVSRGWVCSAARPFQDKFTRCAA